MLSRIQSYLESLKIVFSKATKNIKNKEARLVLDGLKTLLYHENKGLSTVFDSNVPSIIKSILSNDKIKIRNTFDTKEFTATVKFLTGSIERSLCVSGDSKAVTTLLGCLRILLGDQVTCFDALKDSLSGMIINYFTTIDRVYSSTFHFVEIANICLISLLTSDVRTGLMIVHKVLSITASGFNSNYEELKKQLLIFINIAHEYLQNELTPLIGDEDNVGIANADLMVESRAILVKLIKDYYDPSVMTKKRVPGLNIFSISFSNIRDVRNEDTWFDFNTIRLSNSNFDTMWMKLVSITKLLNIYHHLSLKIDTEQAYKKRRSENNVIESALKTFETPENFICSLFDSKDYCALGLQIALFYLSNFPCKPLELHFESYLSQSLAEDMLKPWVSAVFRSLLLVGVVFENDVLVQVLRLSLQMLKTPEYCDVACQTAIQIISMPDFCPDKSLLYFIDSIYKFPIINGPAVLSDASIEFWVATSKYATSRDTKASRKIVDWILSIITSANLKNLSLLVSFVGWLFGNSFSNFHVPRKTKSLFVRFNGQLEETITLARMIFGTSRTSTVNVHSLIVDETPLPMDKETISMLLKTSLDILNQSEEAAPLVLLSMISFGFLIFQHVSVLPGYESDTGMLKFSITRLLEGLTITPEEKLSMICGLSSIQIINRYGLFIKDCIDPSTICKDFENDGSNSQSNSRSSTPDDEFGSSFNSIRSQHQNVSPILDTYTDLLYNEFAVSHETEFLIKHHCDYGFSETSLNSMTDEVVRFLRARSNQDAIVGLYTLLNFFKINDIDTISSNMLSEMVALVADKILQSKEYRNSPIGRIISADLVDRFFHKIFIKNISQSNDVASLLAGDVTDIFYHLMENLSVGPLAFTTAEVIRSLKLCFQVLQYQELLELIKTSTDYVPKVNTDDIFKVLNSSGNLVLTSALLQTTSFIQGIDPREQLKYFNDYLCCVKDPFGSCEGSATFIVVLRVFSGVSLGFLTAALIKVFENADSFHLKTYSETFALDLINEVKISGNYDPVVMELLVYWINCKDSLEQFPFSLLGFNTFEEFVLSCQRILYPVVQSRKAKRLENLQVLKEYIPNMKNLEKDTTPLQIALSFTNGSDKSNGMMLLSTVLSKKLIPFIILNLLNLLDLSKELETIEKVPQLKDSPYSSFLFAHESLFVLHKPDITIGFVDGVNMILEILKKSNGWTVGSVNFILKQLLLQLSRSLNDFKLGTVVLRRIKLLFILADEEFKQQENLRLLIRFLTPAITKAEMRGDATTLFQLTLNDINAKMLVENFFPYEIFPFIKGVIDVIAGGSYYDDNLKAVLCGLCELLPADHQFKPMFNVFYNCMEGNLSIGVAELCSIVTNLSSVVDDDVLPLLSSMLNLVFMKSSEQMVSYEISVNKETALLLHRLIMKSNLEINDQSRHFIGRYLGEYYLVSGDSMLKQAKEFGDTSFEEDIESNSGGLNFFLSKKINARHTTEIQNLIIIDILIGYAGSFSSAQLRNWGIRDQIESISDEVLSLNDAALGILGLNSIDPKMIIPIDKFVMQDNMMLPFEAWIHKLSLSLTSSLIQHFPVLKPVVSNLFNQEYSSTFNLVNELWILNIDTLKEQEELFLKFVSYFQDNFVGFDNKKLKVVLRLVQTVRVLALKGAKPYARIYQKFSLKALSQMATHAGLMKFSLLILEDSRYRDQNCPLVTDSKNLLDIYEGISDNDLFFGVPTEASLDFALASLVKDGGSNHASTLTFESAKIDASRMLNLPTRSMEQLMNSLKSNNFVTLSGILAETNVTTAAHYDWSWKLNKWDLPEPKEPKNEAEIIYKVLRNIHRGEPQTKIGEMCESLYSLLVKNSIDNTKNYEQDLLKQFSIILTVERLAGSPNLDLSNDIKRHSRAHPDEQIFQVRRMIYPMLRSSRVSESDVILSIAYECLSLARVTHGCQKSQIHATYFVEFAKTIKDSAIKNMVTKLSTFNAAIMLWEMGEKDVSIQMLLSNLAAHDIVVPDDSTFPLSILEVPDPVLYGFLIDWFSKSKQKKPEEIMELVNLSLKSIEDFDDFKEKSNVFHKIARFCYDQLKKTDMEEQIGSLRTRINELNRLIMSITPGLKSRKEDIRELKGLQADLKRVNVTYGTETERLQTLESNQKSCIEKALACFLKSMSLDDSHDNEDIDKFFAIWFEYSKEKFVNTTIAGHLSAVPLHKFIPWTAQLTSRLSSTENDFQNLLKLLITEITQKHPFHSVYHIMNMDLYESYEGTDLTVISRMEAARSILNRLENDDTSLVIKNMRIFCKNILYFGSDISENVTEYNLSNLNYGDFWLKHLPLLKVPLPTMNNISVSLVGDYSSVPRIYKVHDIVRVAASGISKPKIIQFTLTDGSTQKAVLKGQTDDLRQDAILEQVFSQVNVMLKHDHETRVRKLGLRTYKVVPLGPSCGIIEFVADSLALGDALKPLHSAGKEMDYGQASKLMRENRTKSNKHRLNVFKKIISSISPKFHLFFLDNFPNVEEWFESRRIYTRGLAVTSFVGHVMGLGDRHLNNILLDQRTCEPIHIDFGITFDQGRFLPIPELVPFRLTRDMVDGLGVTGVKGSFERCSIHTYRVLRENSETILGILRVLELDPLHSWVISKARKEKIAKQFGSDCDLGNADGSISASDAVNAIKSCEYKLIGNRLSIEATVQELIQEATDLERLSVIFAGWSPFY